MSKHEQKAAVLEREEKRPPVTAIDESWPLGEAGAKQKKKTGRESPLNRFSQALHNTLVKGLSNLRLSLTLRIALHYAGQLLKTTIPMLVVTLGVLGATQYPKASRALDELAKMKPADGRNYTVEQLENLPFERAYLLEQPLDGGLPGLGERLGLLFSQLNLNGESCLMLYTETPMGGLMGAYRITDLMFMGTVLFWTLICADLYRVGYFLRHRNRLNKKVLKPITDMAETAATLSANNLSDRISVEGAKNELKDLALVINGMLDRIEVSYNSQKQFVSDASHELRTPIA
ncbi:MAG: HAMP domain-containing protein, partial [Clostridiales bacterium]|nr:HAMP domain-containing protein [Clostridiales bacterium]